MKQSYRFKNGGTPQELLGKARRGEYDGARLGPVGKTCPKCHKTRGHASFHAPIHDPLGGSKGSYPTRLCSPCRNKRKRSRATAGLRVSQM